MSKPESYVNPDMSSITETINANINEMDVRDFLTQNPDFFISNYDLLDTLTFPETGSAQGTSSLVDKQISFLRERNLELRNRLTSFIDIARSNDILLKQTRKIILSLISHKNFDDFAGALRYGLITVFQLDNARLVLFSDNGSSEVTTTETDEIIFVDSLTTAKMNVPALTELKKPLCGNLRSNELSYFFGDAASRIGSVALVPLNYKTVRGFLIAGKADPLHFKSSMDTLFFETLAASIERLIYKHFAAHFKTTS